MRKHPIALTLFLLCCLWSFAAAAQEATPYDITPFEHGSPAVPTIRRHPPEHMELHERFYSNWMRPDYPEASCCNRSDCYPTAAYFKDGSWYAQRREDGRWLRIPPAKIERNRDSPDGRSHLCAPPADSAWPGTTVYCFVPGISG